MLRRTSRRARPRGRRSRAARATPPRSSSGRASGRAASRPASTSSEVYCVSSTITTTVASRAPSRPPPSAMSLKWCGAIRRHDDVERPVGERQVLGAADHVRPACRARGRSVTTSAPCSRSRRATWPPPVATSSALRPGRLHTRRRRRGRRPPRALGDSRYAVARSRSRRRVMPRAPRPSWPPRASSARRRGSAGAASARICRPSSAFVPSRRTTIGARDRIRSSAVEDAARDLVAARDPAEDVEEDRLAPAGRA